ncbi:hypothetical protein [Paenibacillus sp. MBLB4367]|uniref:hypothetical protein n=1 Tax=Paenibacillus sp. MBLB4367 TaxID=3384767 RepID=UPI0039080F01
MAAIALVVIGASGFGLISPLVKMALAGGWNELDVSVSQITMGSVLLWCMLAVTPQARRSPFKGPWLKPAGIGVLGFAKQVIAAGKKFVKRTFFVYNREKAFG